MNEKNQLVINASHHNKRIDKVMSEELNDVSRAQIQNWIKSDHLLINQHSVKANYKCQSGDIVEWEVPEVTPLEAKAESMDLEIVYEDEDLLVVNKPKGMVVHPSAGHPAGTLVNGLLHHCQDLSGINGVIRPGIVHRIDRDTSGLLMVAKNDQAHQSLAEQLQNKTVKRSYIALVHGQIEHEYGTIDAPIGRDPKDRQRMAVISDGKEARTHFEVLERIKDEYTLVNCVLETGRTHQIRVHMKYIGFPLVGDPKYSIRKTLDMNGQALHAKTIGFYHPRTKEWLEFEAEPPVIFTETIEKIKL
ncbi:ribosomal large subunit pseudouridine synthase D [Pelagirhabdus alkalitolerans]|uniref:Pseudouridine synthase n=1 Tax=Pelagirhabdus alkalitolerans TaxID=1612202 RepID=A0A1G6H0Z2_9BACI|nr:RluA family pseudouridine synthase [Pelagirhabdus alkalitolerans]SDB87813.1 ribosomal large subunit pseudouridine synthase D [Pelagirhabdus alkalitolerans]